MEQTQMERERLRIDIHEHIGPIRERMSKVEGKLESQEKELTLLRQGLDSLRDRLERARVEIFERMDKHHEDIVAAIGSHERREMVRMDEFADKLNGTTEAQSNLKAWVLGVNVGVAIVVFLANFGEKLVGWLK